MQCNCAGDLTEHTQTRMRARLRLIAARHPSPSIRPHPNGTVANRKLMRACSDPARHERARVHTCLNTCKEGSYICWVCTTCDGLLTIWIYGKHAPNIGIRFACCARCIYAHTCEHGKRLSRGRITLLWLHGGGDDDEEKETELVCVCVCVVRYVWEVRQRKGGVDDTAAATHSHSHARKGIVCYSIYTNMFGAESK